MAVESLLLTAKIGHLSKGRTQEQYQTASSWGHRGLRGSHVRSFSDFKKLYYSVNCLIDSHLTP
eukprot:scaffold124096_cov22-Cyclotella_meneghiniana.AAC.1